MTSLSRFNAVWNPIGFARPNRHQFVISPPPGLINFNKRGSGNNIGLFGDVLGSIATSIVNGAVGELLSFSCKSIETPNAAFNKRTIATNGTIKKRPLDKDYDDITAEFYIDSKYAVYQFFLSWHNIISNHQNKARGYPEDFVSPQSSIFLYDDQGLLLSPTQDMKLINLWPSEIGSIKNDWENDTEVSILPVKFTYDYCTNGWLENFNRSTIERGARTLLNRVF